MSQESTAIKEYQTLKLVGSFFFIYPKIYSYNVFFKLPVNLHSLSLLCVEFKAKIGWKVHKFRSNWSQAAVVVVTLSENGVRTTLWGGVCPIYSSWGACQSVTAVEQKLHYSSRAMRSTAESDSVTIFTVGCKS